MARVTRNSRRPPVLTEEKRISYFSSQNCKNVARKVANIAPLYFACYVCFALCLSIVLLTNEFKRCTPICAPRVDNQDCIYTCITDKPVGDYVRGELLVHALTVGMVAWIRFCKSFVPS